MFQRDEFSARKIPANPGVYVYRDAFRKVIYVGKAKSLRQRMSSYFQPSRLKTADAKLRSLINSIAYFQYYEVKSDSEALLLESRLIKQYHPRFNILMRDDKNFLLVKVNMKHSLPKLVLTRLKKDDGAHYFGPFPKTGSLRQTIDFINRYFNLRTCAVVEPNEEDKKHCKEHIIRQCSAPCDNTICPDDYRQLMQKAILVLEGDISDICNDLQDQMKILAEKCQFEKAALYRDIIENLKSTLNKERTFARALIGSDAKNEKLHQALLELQQKLELPVFPHTIECFDNSNFQGSFPVSSMVRFVDGKPDSKGYRHFRVKTVDGPDDFASMKEVVGRRYRRLKEEKKKLPDLILIDGGKGQLSAAFSALEEYACEHIAILGIAKRFELLYRPGDSAGIMLDEHSPALHILQHLRDEAHRFAITHHRSLRNALITNSLLDEIPGIGPQRKKALLKAFGSVSKLRQAKAEDICNKVEGIGIKMAESLLLLLRKN